MRGIAIFTLTVAALLLVGGIGAWAATRHSSARWTERKPPGETKDRLSASDLSALVSGPADLLARGRRDEADAAFRKLLAEVRGQNRQARVRRADLLTAWGLELYSDGQFDENDDTRSLSLPWFREAVVATREAWGPDHAETALALQNLADVMFDISPEEPGAEAVQLLRDAYAIRLKALGPRNGETLYNMKRLADALTAGPAAAVPDASRASEAEGLYRTVLRDIRASAAVNPSEIAVGARLRLARLYAQTGRRAAAIQEARLATGDARASPDEPMACDVYETGASAVAEALEAHGDAAAAARLRSALDEDVSRCRANVGV
jgi:tetratricopeptide (TPR) repeat protein